MAQRPAEPDLRAKADRLQAKLESIESVRAIKRLQYAYGHYVEFGLWNDFADLFAEDAKTNYQQGAQGREGVRRLFFEQVGQGKLGLADGRIYPHILFQPVISLSADGKSAKGRWRILAMLGGLGGSATWYSGVYENEYVSQGGIWKISSLRSEPKATAPYTATGWKASEIRLPLHYVSAGSPISVSPVRAAEGESLAALTRRAQDLAQRAIRLNDQSEVTNLQDTYGDALNRKQWGQAADLFASDGTLELGLQGVYAGRTNVRRGLEAAIKGDHLYLQTLVTVTPDGRTANARGVEYIFGGTELVEGVFENTFVKQGGAWKIQSVHFYPRMIVDAAEGWAKSAKPAPGPSKEVPPNRPPTSTYEIYPKFTVAPFHFDNPVTGKMPQYPEGVRAPAKAVAAAPAPRPNADLRTLLEELERSLAKAEAYDITENLLNAYGYSQDDSASPSGGITFSSQILQPIIDIAPTGKAAKVRARYLDLGGVSGAAGYWSAGTLEGNLASEQGAWTFQSPRSKSTWVAPYPGGWSKVQ